MPKDVTSSMFQGSNLDPDEQNDYDWEYDEEDDGVEVLDAGKKMDDDEYGWEYDDEEEEEENKDNKLKLGNKLSVNSKPEVNPKIIKPMRMITIDHVSDLDEEKKGSSYVTQKSGTFSSDEDAQTIQNKMDKKELDEFFADKQDAGGDKELEEKIIKIKEKFDEQKSESLKLEKMNQ